MPITFTRTGDWNKFIDTLTSTANTYEKLGDMEIAFKADAEYSGYQEYGTQYQSGTPFFYDNFEDCANKVADILNSPDPTPEKIMGTCEGTLSNMQSDAPVDTGFLQSEIKLERRR